MSAPTTSRYTSEGTNTGHFDAGDWGLLALTALIWGSSFLWIAIGLDHFHPGVVGAGRMICGAAVLWAYPAARTPLPREAWGAVAVVTVAGNAAPAVFFPLAQERVESSVAGMLNSAGPILTLLLSIAMLRKAPPARQVIGLFIGMAGAVLLALPNLSGADAQPLGLFFVFCAIIGYSVSNNFLPPLAQQYGAAPVIARAMVASAVMLAPWGVTGLDESTFDWGSFGAVIVLGIVGTGFARTIFATLNGRIGAPRSALIGYLIPVVAVVLGVVVRDESVGPLELGGTALILFGAGLISRARQRM